MTTREEALLVFADGRIFAGRTYGATGQATGPAVFSTAITGYQELFTNPASAGQILVMTAPHIGNTGVNEADRTSPEYTLAGVVVRDPSRLASNWRAEGELEPELVAAGVVGICDIDTRAITRHLRNQGPLDAGIFSGTALPPGALEGNDAARAALVEAVKASSGKEAL